MSPNTSYDQTEDGITVAGYEYGAEIFEDYFENGIPPHARAFRWECIDVSEIARGFDAGEEYGSSVLRDQASYAAESYHELTLDEKNNLHKIMLHKLAKKKVKSDEIVNAYRVIVPELLRVLAAANGPVEELENAIKKFLSDAEKKAFDIAADLDDEEECSSELN
jgi:hypothetical protein